MRYFWLVCASMADDPLDALAGRTPLEIAKTPFMDGLAKKAILANATWLDATLPASDEVAAYSMLGYDPKEYYTGLAPMESLGAGVPQNDAQMVFRCDFVTVSDGHLIDPRAGLISPTEAQVLVKELNKKLTGFNSRIVPVEGYKNLLIVDDPSKVEQLDEIECVSPSSVQDQRVSEWTPKGRAADFLHGIADATREILENHEINRVRIDLKENPASRIWLWGQGKRAKLPSFAERNGLRSAFLTERLSWRGLALSAEMRRMKKWDEHEFADFNLVESGGDVLQSSQDYKAKVRRIEDFDANIVGRLAAVLEKSKEPTRVLITSDVVHSSVKGANTHAHAPILFCGAGVEGPGAAAFNEKNCGLSGRLYDPGHSFLQTFLKG